MRGRTSIDVFRVRYSHKVSVLLLSLLAPIAACAAQPQAPAPPEPPAPAQPQGQPEPQTQPQTETSAQTQTPAPPQVQPQPQVPRQPRPQTPGPARRMPAGARLKTIQLPEPNRSSAFSLEQSLAGQRNGELPGSQRLEFPKIGQLAWAAQGSRVPPATNASGPAQAPADVTAMKIYFVLPDGIYLYTPAEHALQQLSDADVRQPLSVAVLNQPAGPIGGCQIILAGAAREFAVGQGTRGRTLMLLQAGRMSQSIQLQAVALGLTLIGVDNVESNTVRRIARLPRNVEPLCVALVGYPSSQTPQTATLESTPQTAKAALLIIPSQSFQDEELFGTRRALELAGVQVTVASTRMGMLAGMMGGTAQPDLLLNQANVDNFNAIVFIGGVRAIDYFSNPVAQNLARQAVERHKVLAASGIAPGILANAGVLKGIRATAFLPQQELLARGGAIYTGNPVEKDGLIVTSTGPYAVTVFAQAILDGLIEAR